MILLSTLLLSVASADPLSAGELPDNAFTLPRGEVMLSIGRQSAVALGDRSEAKSDLLADFSSPNLAFEATVVHRPDGAVSLEPFAEFPWDVDTWKAGGWLRGTRVLGEDRGTIGLGYEVEGYAEPHTLPDEASIRRSRDIPVYLGYERVKNDRNTWNFHALARPGNAREVEGEFGRAGFSWNHAGKGSFRLLLGADLVVGEETSWGVPEDVQWGWEEEDLPQPPDLGAFPELKLALWWTF